MSPELAGGPPAAAPPEPARVEIVALAGLPEIVPGDDLPTLVGDALERTAGVLPIRPGDVLVVTQKVVSKAEGAVVDLRTVEPRPEAVEWARRLGPRRAPDRGRPAGGAPRRPDGARRPDHGDAPRVRVREQRRGRLERRARVRRRRHAAPARSGRIGAANPRGAARRGTGTTSRSSSATASAGPGAGASSTSRWACRGSCRSRTCAAGPMRTGGSCAPRCARGRRARLGRGARPGQGGGRPVVLVRGAQPPPGEGSVREQGLIPAEMDCSASRGAPGRGCQADDGTHTPASAALAPGRATLAP